MATIDEHDDLLTVIVAFTVPADDQARLVEHLQGVAAEHSQHDGFVSCAIHRSHDGTRVTEYIQWQSREHFQAMMASQGPDAHVHRPPFPADVHTFEVVSVTERVTTG